jgi:uroporphyrinogen decarboxylase
MLSGKENYRRAIEFYSPAYLPITLACNPGRLFEKDKEKVHRIRELQARFPDDLLAPLGVWRNAHPRRNAGRPPAGRRSAHRGSDDRGSAHRQSPVRWKDEWGVGWITEGLGYFSEFHPLEEGFHLLSDYAFPDPHLPERFVEDDRRLAERADRYVRPQVWYTLFERLWLLRGFNNALTDPYLEEKNFFYLQDRLLEIYLALIDQWIDRGVDAVYFSDDWGSQQNLLIKPEDWRRFYKPAYATLFRRVRDGGAHVWLHSCGHITEIIGDLIDVGLNVLNPIQSQAMDVTSLAREFGGRLCFNGGVDTQGTMINGSAEDVKSEVHRMVSLFGAHGGGYIGGTSQSIMKETPLDNVLALYEAFAGYSS